MCKHKSTHMQMHVFYICLSLSIYIYICIYTQNKIVGCFVQGPLNKASISRMQFLEDTLDSLANQDG